MEEGQRLGEEDSEGDSVLLLHFVAVPQPVAEGVLLTLREVVSERLGVPVGVEYCVVGTGEGLTLPVLHRVAVGDTEVDCEGERVPLRVGLVLTLCVLGAVVGMPLEVIVPEAHALREGVVLIVPDAQCVAEPQRVGEGVLLGEKVVLCVTLTVPVGVTY